MVGHWCGSQCRHVCWVTSVGHGEGMWWVTNVGHSVCICGGSLMLVTV